MPSRGGMAAVAGGREDQRRDGQVSSRAHGEDHVLHARHGQQAWQAEEEGEAAHPAGAHLHAPFVEACTQKRVDRGLSTHGN